MKEQVTQVNNMNRKDLGKLKVNRMQLAVTYRTLPSMSKNISKKLAHLTNNSGATKSIPGKTNNNFFETSSVIYS